eukprot:394366-Hanusia_phi.AAC.1
MARLACQGSGLQQAASRGAAAMARLALSRTVRRRATVARRTRTVTARSGCPATASLPGWTVSDPGPVNERTGTY